jgi:hypothetical protein
VLLPAGNRSIALWATFCVTEWAVKQVLHKFVSEALPRCLKSSPCPLQVVTVLIVVVCIRKRSATTTATTSMIQAPLHKAIPPLLVEVVTFNSDDEVVQDDTDASPHDDDQVAPRVDKLDAYLLQRLEGSLQ